TYFLFGNYNLLYFHEKEQKYVLAQIDPLSENYTASDYFDLPESAPFELIHGKLIFMASPKNKHQILAIELASILHIYVKKNKLGQIMIAPSDVHLDDKNVVQPDLYFVCIERAEILENDPTNEAPDMTVEILSDGTKADDYKRKMQLYAKFGVLEYWIIDIKQEKVEVYENQKQEMVLVQKAFTGGKISSKVIKGFVLENKFESN
ncbi:MAG: Uma2 family endonuclease, partial [Bacteroidetes bacterium]